MILKDQIRLACLKYGYPLSLAEQIAPKHRPTKTKLGHLRTPGVSVEEAFGMKS